DYYCAIWHSNAVFF
nr:immunoglobulin light chain junction region [Macaca mulatta]MOY06957.1 immunoglobulin light chain junction region [Macaca mulatta]MOY07862.1 immunoglobulin light chain junction region [Macaca mulatta]MOY09686.1 immunoglobulin light chain junction region [Macaca mulatta]